MYDEGCEINEGGRRGIRMARSLCPFLCWNEHRCNKQDRRDHNYVSGLRRVKKDPAKEDTIMNLISRFLSIARILIKENTLLRRFSEFYYKRSQVLYI